MDRSRGLQLREGQADRPGKAVTKLTSQLRKASSQKAKKALRSKIEGQGEAHRGGQARTRRLVIAA